MLDRKVHLFAKQLCLLPNKGGDEVPEKQVKSKQRVADHGEVFTNEREVKAMCDLVKQETERIDSRFLEKTFSTLIQPVVILGNGRKWTHFSDSFENGRIWAQ